MAASNTLIRPLSITRIPASTEQPVTMFAGAITYYGATTSLGSTLAAGSSTVLTSPVYAQSAGVVILLTSDTATSSLDPTEGMGVLVHGSNASLARPNDYAQYTWVGTVQPSNMDDNDIWIDTT